MSIEIEFHPLLLDCVFDNYDKVIEQFTKLVNNTYTEKYNHSVKPVIKEKIYYWLEKGQRNNEYLREVTNRLYWISEYYEVEKGYYGKQCRYDGKLFNEFSEKFYIETLKLTNKYCYSDEQYKLCRSSYLNWIREREGLPIYSEEETKKLRQEKSKLEHDRKYPLDKDGKNQYNFYLSEFASKKEITENNKLLKKGQGKQPTPPPSERELELTKILEERDKDYKKVKELLDYTTKKTSKHNKFLKQKTFKRNVLTPTINIGDGLNFFRLKKIDKEKNRATNLGEKATHYTNCIGWEFNGTHSVQELEHFARENGYKPKPKDKYEDYKIWLIENLYKKN